MNFRVDKKGNVYVFIGKVSFFEEKIKENMFELVKMINCLKFSSVKGKYIRNVVFLFIMLFLVNLDV